MEWPSSLCPLCHTTLNCGGSRQQGLIHSSLLPHFSLLLDDTDTIFAANTRLHSAIKGYVADQHRVPTLGRDNQQMTAHVLAVLRDPAYREANAVALGMEWPRIPVPGWPAGDEVGAADELAKSAARGRDLPRCWTRTRRCQGSRLERCVLRYRSSRCRPPRTGATSGRVRR